MLGWQVLYPLSHLPNPKAQWNSLVIIFWEYQVRQQGTLLFSFSCTVGSLRGSLLNSSYWKLKVTRAQDAVHEGQAPRIKKDGKNRGCKECATTPDLSSARRWSGKEGRGHCSFCLTSLYSG